MNWMELVCDNIPEDWEIRICMREGEASVDLIDPDGNEVEMCDDDLTVEQMLIARIDKARVSDGLQPMGADPNDFGESELFDNGIPM